MRYKFGISTCPNDTFMFHALLEDKLDTAGLNLSIELRDVQELNLGLQQGAFQLSKASAAAAIAMAHRYEVCSAGAAIGFGVGPLLLAHQTSRPLSPDALILCPGELTTAYLLMRHLFPQTARFKQCVFSEIMPALQRGEADYGVVIHEGRFTYAQYGLRQVADLGALWEEAEKVPLALGVIVADRSLPEEVRAQFDLLLQRSVAYACAHRQETFATMKRYAQELDEGVIWAHVDLYVNQWSRALGAEGRQALRALARVAGVFDLVMR